jgi:hypothetical protein
MKTVKRAYAICDAFKTVHRVLVDDKGFVFYPGTAWVARPYPHHRLKVLPEPLPYTDWFEGWWESNWKKSPEWVWCYGMAPKGRVR